MDMLRVLVFERGAGECLSISGEMQVSTGVLRRTRLCPADGPGHVQRAVGGGKRKERRDKRKWQQRPTKECWRAAVTINLYLTY